MFILILQLRGSCNISVTLNGILDFSCDVTAQRIILRLHRMENTSKLVVITEIWQLRRHDKSQNQDEQKLREKIELLKMLNASESAVCRFLILNS